MEVELYNYLTQAAGSMLYNKQMYGSYTPGAWWVGSLGDHILRLLFMLFDSYEKVRLQIYPSTGDISIESYAAEWLCDCNWGEQRYLEKHVLGIALRVAERTNNSENKGQQMVLFRRELW